jgi:hypothetical protein
MATSNRTKRFNPNVVTERIVPVVLAILMIILIVVIVIAGLSLAGVIFST